MEMELLSYMIYMTVNLTYHLSYLIGGITAPRRLQVHLSQCIIARVEWTKELSMMPLFFNLKIINGDDIIV